MGQPGAHSNFKSQSIFYFLQTSSKLAEVCQPTVNPEAALHGERPEVGATTSESESTGPEPGMGAGRPLLALAIQSLLQKLRMYLRSANSGGGQAKIEGK